MQDKYSKRWWIVSIIGILALIAWVLTAPQVTNAANGEPTQVQSQAQSQQAQRAGRNSYQSPATMRNRFRQGDYNNARGIKLPVEFTRLAKRYCNNHPGKCPRSVPTRNARRGDECSGTWSWLQWTCDRLKTTHCLAVIFSGSWLGCDDQPSWVHKVRRTEVICGGDALIAFFGRTAPVVVGSAVHCFYEGVYGTWLDEYAQ